MLPGLPTTPFPNLKFSQSLQNIPGILGRPWFPWAWSTEQAPIEHWAWVGRGAPGRLGSRPDISFILRGRGSSPKALPNRTAEPTVDGLTCQTPSPARRQTSDRPITVVRPQV